MKIVVQNGSSNPITRQEIEAIVEILPESLINRIRCICLYGNQKSQVEVTYHPKDELLGIHAKACGKLAVVEELVISIVLLSELGHIPKRQSTNMRQKFLEENSQLLTACQKVIGDVAAT